MSIARQAVRPLLLRLAHPPRQQWQSTCFHSARGDGDRSWFTAVGVEGGPILGHCAAPRSRARCSCRAFQPQPRDPQSAPFRRSPKATLSTRERATKYALLHRLRRSLSASRISSFSSPVLLGLMPTSPHKIDASATACFIMLGLGQLEDCPNWRRQ
jgi:hypothetical protein